MYPSAKVMVLMEANDPWPVVSVIMPVRNERAYIQRSLGAVLAQDYPAHSLEVLVVDGMSEDGTRDVVRAMEDNPRGIRVLLLDNPARIVPTALNIGLRHARGAVIVRVDGHCEIAPDYVRQCVCAIQDTGADNVGGVWVTVGETPIARAIAVAQSSSFGIGNVAYRVQRTTPGYVDTVPFGAYRREVFRRLGGFDERLVRHQDYEFNVRLRQAGGKIYYTPAIQARYYSRSSFRKLAKQYLEYGFWKAFVTLENPGVLAWRHLAPIGLVGSLAGGGLLSIFATWARPLLAGLCAAYIVACVAMAVREARRAGWRYVFLLPVAFATIHLCWGAGFWWGLLRNGAQRLMGRAARRAGALAPADDPPEQAGMSFKKG